MGGWHERRCLTFCYSDRWGAFSTPGASLICSVAARPDESCSSQVWMWSRPAKSPKASTAPAEKPHLMNNRQKQIWFTEATMIVITVHLSIRKSRSSVLLTSSRWLFWWWLRNPLLGNKKKKRWEVQKQNAYCSKQLQQTTEEEQAECSIMGCC